MKVSIITPAYNAEAYIEETIQSILGQSYSDLEYIVVNDGSTDGTLSRVQPYSKHLKLISHANQGEQASVNRGMEAASSDVVAVVNADDPILPGLIQEAVAFLKEHPEVVAVYPDWLEIDANGLILREVKTPNYDYNIMLEQFYCIPGPGVFLRRSALGGEPVRNTSLRYTADFDLWLRLGLKGPLARLPKTLATWRNHAAGLTQSSVGHEFCENRIDLMKLFFKRPDLPEEVKKKKHQAYSAAYYQAGLLALQDSQIRGRRYFFWSVWHRWRWPTSFIPLYKRSWLRMAYVWGSPLSRWLYHKLLRKMICFPLNRNLEGRLPYQKFAETQESKN